MPSAVFQSRSLSNSADVYKGIVSSLTPEQADAFDNFRNQLSKQGLRNAPKGITTEDLCNGINDDATFLRFLRARSYVVEDAMKQFKESYSFRDTTNVAKIYDLQDVEDYEETRKIYPHWTGRRDKRGLPIMISDIANINSKSLAAYSKSCSLKASTWPTSGKITVEQLRSFAFHDDLIRFVIPLCSAVKDRPNPEKPITGTVHIADISSLGLRQFWSIKGWLLSFASVVSNSMPETLDTVLVIGAPSYFPTIWAWIKKFIDPGTVAKLNIVRANEVQSTLSSYIDIENIPKRYGGNFDFEHGMAIDLDPALVESLTWSCSIGKLIKGPMKWVDGGDGTKHIIAVGSQGGRKRYEKIATLKPTENQIVETEAPRANIMNNNAVNPNFKEQNGGLVNHLDYDRAKSAVTPASSYSNVGDLKRINGYAEKLSNHTSTSLPDIISGYCSSTRNEPVLAMPDWPTLPHSQTWPLITNEAEPTREPSTTQTHSGESVSSTAPNRDDEQNNRIFNLSQHVSTRKPQTPMTANTSPRPSLPPRPSTNQKTELKSKSSRHEGIAPISDGEEEHFGDTDHFVDAQDWSNDPCHATTQSRSANYSRDSRSHSHWIPYPTMTATTITAHTTLPLPTPPPTIPDVRTTHPSFLPANNNNNNDNTTPITHIPHICTCNCSSFAPNGFLNPNGESPTQNTSTVNVTITSTTNTTTTTSQPVTITITVTATGMPGTKTTINIPKQQ